MSTAALFRVARRGSNSNTHQQPKWVNKVCPVHAVKYSAPERNEFLTWATAWTNLENIVPSEIGQTQKATYYMLDLHETGKSI